MCEHLEVIIEVGLILLYSLTYLRLGVSELEFGCSWVVNGLLCEVIVPRHFLNNIDISYNPCNMCKHSEVTIKVTLIHFYSRTHLRIGVSELEFERLG